MLGYLPVESPIGAPIVVSFVNIAKRELGSEQVAEHVRIREQVRLYLVQLRCTVDPAIRGSLSPSNWGRKSSKHS